MAVEKKFKIADLVELDGDPLETDFVVIERDGVSYKISGKNVGGGSTVVINWYGETE